VFHKPVLIHAHGANFESTYFRLPKWAQQGFSNIVRQCNGFIVLSNTWKNFYTLNLGLDSKKVVVLPNPTEIPSQVPNRTNSPQVNLVFFGRVGQRKGTFDLIRAFANLPVELKNRSKLTIAGDGEIEEAKQLVEIVNLTDYVNFLGWIDSQERNAVLLKADVFVLPSYNEGLPMAILEAMSWSLPVITTPVGGIPELIISNENGLLVNPGDIEQLSKLMESLIENEALRLSLGRAARETVTAFDIKKYWSSIEDIYDSAMRFNLR
jgi:glycosyltransferase involved in cell wall biosynthesis